MIGRREPQQGVATTGPVPDHTRLRETGAMQANFVLVHGAWHGGWCWRPVATQLRAAGARVFTPTLTGLGCRYHLRGPAIGFDTHVTDIEALLVTEELDDVILVGHSYGGAVIEAVADRVRDRLRRLVFLDGTLLEPGESTFDFFGTDEARVAKMRAQAVDSIGVTVPPPKIFGVAESDTDTNAWLARRLTPHPLKSFEDRFALPHGGAHDVPALLVHAVQPPFPGLERSVERARARGWRTFELQAGHDAMVTHPDLVSALLLAEAAGK
jgi:pimeloyl-ACP methyl ester carboxylesterase